MSFRPWVIGILLTTVMTASVEASNTAEPGDELRYSEVIPDYLRSHGWKDSTPRLEEFLQKSYVSLDVGGITLAYPRRFLEDRKRAEEWEDIVAGVLELQIHWLRWTDIEARKKKGPAAAASARLVKWVRSWKSKAIVKAVRGAGEERDFLRILEADADVVEAADEFRAAVLATGEISQEPEAANPTPLVLCPDRVEFVGLACLVAEVEPAARTALWVSGMPRWTNFYWNRLRVIALEHPANDPAAAYQIGQAMNNREKTGLLQHVSWYAARNLITRLFGSRLDVSVEGGLATDLVIELCGENNARAGGAATGNTTAGRSKFVRGGNPNGGKLPMVSADSQWRQAKGKDHFVRDLRKGQKAGTKLGKDTQINPLAWFAMDGTGSVVQHAVPGPFLGSDIGEKHIPDSYLPDYQDFLRSYDAAFVHWLRTKAPTLDRKQSSQQALAALLRDTARESGESFQAHAERIYGLPLSSAGVSSDTLEGRFLHWLSRQK